MQFDTLRPTRLVSGTGHTMFLQPNDERHVPEVLHAAALAVGCMPRDGSDPAPAAPTAAPANPAAAESKHELLVAAIRELIAENDDTKFTKSGPPRKASLAEKVEIAFTQEEAQAAYDEVANATESGE